MTETRVTNKKTGGQKGTKPARFDLLPPDPLWQVAELYGKGAEKYEPRNWQRGYEWSLSFAALQRHAWQFWNGETVDPETECHHLASVIFHALALMEFEVTHPELDDRADNRRESNLLQSRQGHIEELLARSEPIITHPDNLDPHIGWHGERHVVSP